MIANPLRRRLAIVLLSISGSVLFGQTDGTANQEEAKALPEPFAVASPPADPAAEAAKKIELSVVRITSTTRNPDISKPWSKLSPQDHSGSGVVIDGRRILTNAHVVRNSSNIQIQANQSSEKISATVEFIAQNMDLAVLKLDDEKFFDTHAPLPLAKTLPALKDTVMAYGYPVGGNGISITKGIVSRIDYITYAWPTHGLRVQIDAAINKGNSGGPVIGDGCIVGLAFSGMSDAQNIGYIIPAEEIALFLEDIKDGRYDGKAFLALLDQTLDNPAVRAALKVPAGVEGSVLCELPEDGADFPLKRWDLITAVAGHPVDREGMIKLPQGVRLRWTYYVQNEAVAGKIRVSVLREGRPLELEVPLRMKSANLVENRIGAYPSYFVYGPLVLENVTTQTYSLLMSPPKNMTAASMAQMLMSMAGRGSAFITRRGDIRQFDDEEMVFVPAPFFPHKLSKGYSSPMFRVLKSINGVPVRNIRHAAELLRDCTEAHTRIEFHGFGETYFFPHKETLAVTEDILNDNGVRSRCSSDLEDVWRK